MCFFKQTASNKVFKDLKLSTVKLTVFDTTLVDPLT